MTNQNISLTNYDAQLADAQRRQKLAELLQSQADQPIEIQSYKGIQAPISPMAGLAKVLEGLTGVYGEKKAAKELDSAQASARTDAANSAHDMFFQPSQGSPVPQDLQSGDVQGVGVTPQTVGGIAPTSSAQQLAAALAGGGSSNHYTQQFSGAALSGIMSQMSKDAEDAKKLQFAPQGSVPYIGNVPQPQIPNQALEAKPPTTRVIERGMNNVTQEYDDKTKTWKDIGTGPKFAPQAPKSIIEQIQQKMATGGVASLTQNERDVLNTNNKIIPLGTNEATPGIVGHAEIDPTVPGYASKPVGDSGLSQASIDQKALSYITSGTLPPQGRTGIAGVQNAAISNRMAEMAPGGNLAVNKTQLKALSTSLSNQTDYLNNTERAFNTANDTLDSLQTWMQKNNVNPSQFPDANKFYNYLKSKGVNPGQAGGYNAQLATLRAEYSQVLAKGGVRSVETDRQAAQLIPDGLAPADLAKVAERIKVDGNNVVNDAQNQVAKITKQIWPSGGGQATQPAAGALRYDKNGNRIP